MARIFGMTFDELSREMEAATAELQSYPAEREYSAQAIDELETVRRNALALVRECEAILDEFNGQR